MDNGEANKKYELNDPDEPQPIAVPLLGHNKKLIDKDYEFVGRDKLISTLVKTLEDKENGRGCYLISGYRGSGKTNLIELVLDIYQGKKRLYPWLPKKINEDFSTADSKSYLRKGFKKLTRQYVSSGVIEKIKEFVSHSYHLAINPLAQLSRRLFKEKKIIRVKINLGHDQSLQPKTVLCNMATLLYQEMENEAPKIIRVWWELKSFLQSLFLLITIMWFGLIVLMLPIEDSSILSFLHSINATASSNDVFLLTIAFSLLLVLLYKKKETQYSRSKFGLWVSYGDVLVQLKELNRRIRSSLELKQSIGMDKYFSFNQKEVLPQLDERQIENELLEILKLCKSVKIVKPQVIFIFDELDKITHQDIDSTFASASIEKELLGRKMKVDTLLGALKNFITHGQARFFFIAGREMLDGYQSERGSTSSLYESLFSRTFEVSSFLTDPTDDNRQHIHSLIETYVCRKLMVPEVAVVLWWCWNEKNPSDYDIYERYDFQRRVAYSPFCLRTYFHYLLQANISPKEARFIIFGLRNFIQFLTLHSWGNPKRLISLFEHFTKPAGDIDWRTSKSYENIDEKNNNPKAEFALQFGVLDQQRILLSSGLYTQLYHDLGRQLASSSDKLAVSTMAALQYILKFHRYPFSRHHLEQMSEALNVHHAPDLNTMIDTLLSKVMYPYIRRIRNSHYRYRFSGDLEQELRYISRINDIESAAFNFSLNASAPNKAHYIEQLNKINQEKTLENDSSTGSQGAISFGLNMTVGDLCLLEQAYDQAIIYYQKAMDGIDAIKDKSARFLHFQVEALLRLGEVYEYRQSYDRASSVYQHAMSLVIKQRGNLELIHEGDSKWDIFRQPFWASWFLQLKRSPASSRDKVPVNIENMFPFSESDPVNNYRNGKLAFFYNYHCDAADFLTRAIGLSGIDAIQTERTCFLSAKTYIHLGENLIIGWLKYSIKSLGIDRVDAREILCILADQLAKIQSPYGLNVDNSNLEKNYRQKKDNGDVNNKDIESRKESFLKCFNLSDAFCLILQGSRLLHEAGLYFHATVGYTRLLSIWAALTDVYALLATVVKDINNDEINKTEKEKAKKQIELAEREIESAKDEAEKEKKKIDHAMKMEKAKEKIKNIETFEEAKRKIENAEIWLNKVRIDAADANSSLTTGGHSRFHTRWKRNDVAMPNMDMQNHKMNFKAGTKKNIENLMMQFTTRCKGDRLDQYHTIGSGIKKNFEIILKQNEFKDISRLSIIEEPTFSHGSTSGQRLMRLTTWQRLIDCQIINKDNLPNIPKLFAPYSISNLLFSHWLKGKQHMNNVLGFEKSVIDRDKFTPYKNWRIQHRMIESRYESASKAIHNFVKVINYSKLLSGNEQDLMFPDSALVLYDIWRLLDHLICNRKNENASFEETTENVARMLSLSKHPHHDIPVIYFDYVSITSRSMDELKELSHLDDITNRTRMGALKTKYYLADDYEDPRFQLDWITLQMYSPIAVVLHNHIKEEFKSKKQSQKGNVPHVNPQPPTFNRKIPSQIINKSKSKIHAQRKYQHVNIINQSSSMSI